MCVFFSVFLIDLSVKRWDSKKEDFAQRPNILIDFFP